MNEAEHGLIQWKRAYPQAISYGPPGFASKVPQLNPIELRDTAPAEWLGEMDLCYMSHERLPIIGKPFFHEVRVRVSSPSS